MKDKYHSRYKKGNHFQQCVRCGLCLGNCSIYQISRLEIDSPRGRLELMRSVSEGRTSSPGEFVDVLSSCLFCLQCQKNCPAGVRFDLTFFQSAMRLSNHDRDILTGVIRRIESGNLAPDPFQLEQSKASKSKMEASKEIIFFPGCFMDDQAIEHVSYFIKSIGIDATVFKDTCCGLPHLLQGNQQKALACMRQNIQILKQKKAKTLLTTCPFCLDMFKRLYPRFVKQNIHVAFRHLGDLCESMISKISLKMSKKVAYQTPCLLDQETAARHRQMIEKLVGKSYVPISSQICCGYGFGLPFHRPDISKRICQGNIQKIIKEGVQCLITDCPSCTIQWQMGARENNDDLEVIPFWDFIRHMISEKGI